MGKKIILLTGLAGLLFSCSTINISVKPSSIDEKAKIIENERLISHNYKNSADTNFFLSFNYDESGYKYPIIGHDKSERNVFLASNNTSIAVAVNIPSGDFDSYMDSLNVEQLVSLYYTSTGTNMVKSKVTHTIMRKEAPFTMIDFCAEDFASTGPYKIYATLCYHGDSADIIIYDGPEMKKVVLIYENLHVHTNSLQN